MSGVSPDLGLSPTMKISLFWFFSSTAAYDGIATFTTPPPVCIVSQLSSALTARMTRWRDDAYSQSNFLRDENWVSERPQQLRRDIDRRFADNLRNRQLPWPQEDYEPMQYREVSGPRNDDYYDYYEARENNYNTDSAREYPKQQQYRQRPPRYRPSPPRQSRDNFESQSSYDDFGQPQQGRYSQGNIGRRSIDDERQETRDVPQYSYNVQDRYDDRGQIQESYREDDFRGQTQGSYRDDTTNDYFGDNPRQRYEPPQNTYDSRYTNSRERYEEQYRSSSEVVKDESFGMERMADGRMRAPFSGIDTMMTSMMDPFFGAGLMRSPFAGFGSGFGRMKQMMNRLNFELEASMNQDQISIDGILNDAIDCLRADSTVTDLLGDRLQLGRMPFAQSSSSVIMNGMRRSRVELGIQITGSRDIGRVRLMAEQGRLSFIEVDVRGRVIRVDNRRLYNYNSRNDDDGEVIDADVVDKEIYY